ncbi:MAG: YciI family protein [Myxococcaceae bacterium]|nr:YciI family protein [Myxococcaceae bacterium]
MRFIVMHKVPPRYETGEVDRREISEMGAFIQKAIGDGVFINGAGLLPKVPRTRIVVRNGQCDVQEGVRCSNNTLAGFALLKVAHRAEAVEWAKRFAPFLKDGELELGRVTEVWDLGFGPKPVDAPERYLALMMANAESEAGTPPSEAEQRAMGAFIGEMVSAGVLQVTEGILPSRFGTRLTFKAGARVTTVDGPFTESKELISGFSLIRVPSKEAALAWAAQYGSILRDIEVDVLALHDEAAFDGTKG